MTRLWLLIIGLLMCTSAEARAEKVFGGYVVVENVRLYDRMSTTYSQGFDVKGPIALRVRQKRSGFWQVETTTAWSSCGGARDHAIARMRLWVVAHGRLRTTVPKGQLRRYRGCGRFMGWIRSKRKRVVRSPVAVAPSKLQREIEPLTKLYWRDGTKAGRLGVAVALTRPPTRRGSRVCAPIQPFSNSGRIEVCFDPGRIQAKKPSLGGVAHLLKPLPVDFAMRVEDISESKQRGAVAAIVRSLRVQLVRCYESTASAHGYTPMGASVRLALDRRGRAQRVRVYERHRPSKLAATKALRAAAACIHNTFARARYFDPGGALRSRIEVSFCRPSRGSISSCHSELGSGRLRP